MIIRNNLGSSIPLIYEFEKYNEEDEEDEEEEMGTQLPF